ncbi:MAG TPA: hypothetical protein VK514_12035 [Candidatus Acidoferrum sp.]|nr:hypothetical protein [Candidatus Acidoferrum sp.]
MSFVCLWAVGDGETEERFPAALGIAEGILPLCNAPSGARRANFCMALMIFDGVPMLKSPSTYPAAAFARAITF